MRTPQNKLTIHFETTDERDRKLKAIMERFGYRVEPAAPERLTIGELAERVSRKPNTVSMSLKRPSCPPFNCKRGARRILWIEPNQELLAFLAEDRKGQRQHPNPATAINKDPR